MSLNSFTKEALILSPDSLWLILSNPSLSHPSLSLKLRPYLSLRLCHQCFRGGKISEFRSWFVPIWIVVVGGGFWVDYGGVRCVWVIVIFELGYSGWLVGLGLSVVLVVSGGWLAVGGCVWYWFVVSLWWECDWVCFGCICKGGCWLVYNWFWVVGMWLGLPLVFFLMIYILLVGWMLY